MPQPGLVVFMTTLDSALAAVTSIAASPQGGFQVWPRPWLCVHLARLGCVDAIDLFYPPNRG